MQSWSQAPPIKELSKEWKIFVTDKFGTMKIVKLPQWNGIVCLVHVYRLRILQEVVPALHQKCSKEGENHPMLYHIYINKHDF